MLNMTKDVVKLGIILKRLGIYDKMQTFDGRLKIQKIIYIMQHGFGLNIGYNFSWYIRGPYSTELTKDGYELIQYFDQLPHGKFKDPDNEVQFNKFIEFLGQKIADPNWLEITASIHFLKMREKNLSKKNIIEKVKDKQVYFTESQCEESWNYLEKWNLVNNDVN